MGREYTFGASDDGGDWRPPDAPPEPYDFVVLRLAEGTIQRGVWTGELWWSYNEKLGRNGPVEPVAWREFTA